MVFTTLSNNSKKHLKIVKPDRAKKKDMGANELIFSGQNIKQLPSKKENNHLNEIYEAVVEGSPNVIIVIDRIGRVLLVNNQTKKLFGYKEDELIGKEIEVIIPGCLYKSHYSYHAFSDRTPDTRKAGVSVKLLAKRKDGVMFPIEISLNSLDIENKIFSLVQVKDLTERNKLIARLYKTIDTLQNVNKELEQFTFIASHDLREPVTTLSAIAELFQQEYGGKLDEYADNYLEYIIESSGRMKTLISDLLDYSKTGREKKVTMVNCNKIVKEVLADIGVSIFKSNTNINVQKLPILRGHSTEIRQLFQNLISNAIKFRKKNIVLEIKITGKKINEDWHFAFQDNGIGINEKYKEKIFNMFQRLHNRKYYEGTGIGLAHCKKIVELHGGKIWVESKANRGSTFYFTIPELIHHGQKTELRITD